jgi:hypothetical protein
MLEVTIPESALVVETTRGTGEAPGWSETYTVIVKCGDEDVFKRVYSEIDGYSDASTAYSLEDAKDKALTELGVKLRVLLGEDG